MHQMTFVCWACGFFILTQIFIYALKQVRRSQNQGNWLNIIAARRPNIGRHVYLKHN